MATKVELEGRIRILQKEKEVLETKVAELEEALAAEAEGEGEDKKTIDALRETIAQQEEALANTENVVVAMQKRVMAKEKELQIALENNATLSEALALAQHIQETPAAIDPPPTITSLPYGVPSGPSHKGHKPE